jgi:cytochrome c-type biogenesis protein CcmH
MMGFAIGATLMVGVTLLLLLLPFRRRPASADFSRQQLNTAIYRDELDELDRDLAEGSLLQSDYEQARGELQRRLLEDTAATDDAAATAPAGRTLPTMIAIALPLCAVLLYLILGNPAALNPPPPAQQFTSEDIDRMVAGLAAKLEKEPENLQGWAMLARSYKAMGRLAEAVNAYRRAGSFVETSPDLLLDYADVLAMQGKGFTDQVRALIDQALKLDPAHPQGLWLRGTAAYDAKEYAKALADWEKLLGLLPPESENAQVVKTNIAEVKALQAPAGKPQKK